MTKKFFTLLAFLAVLLPANAWVQTSHFISFWGAGGVRQNVGDLENTTIPIGYFGNIGIGYEYRAGYFALHTGVGMTVPVVNVSVNDLKRNFEGFDDEGDARIYRYVQTNRSELYTGFDMEIPLMIGAQFKKFYFLVGAKGEFNLWTYDRIKSNIESQGDYADFIDVFKDMPEHTYYSGQTVEQQEGVRFRPNVTASIELGWRFGNPTIATGFDVRKSKWQYRLGFFFDYGLLNYAPAGHHVNLLYLPTEAADGTATDVTMNAALAAYKIEPYIDEANPTRINKDGEEVPYIQYRYLQYDIKNFTIGVKFTALFHVTRWWGCVICNDNSPRVRPEKDKPNWKW